MSVEIEAEPIVKPTHYTLWRWTLDRFFLKVKTHIHEGYYTGETNALGNGVFVPIRNQWEYERSLLDPAVLDNFSGALLANGEAMATALEAFLAAPGPATLVPVLNSVDDIITKASEDYHKDVYLPSLSSSAILPEE